MERFRQVSPLSKEDELEEFFKTILECMKSDLGVSTSPEEISKVKDTERACEMLFKMLRSRALSKQVIFNIKLLTLFVGAEFVEYQKKASDSTVL